MARNMSDAEIRRRKKAQGAISRTTATIGLGGLAALGAAKATGAKPGFLTPVAKPVTRAVRRAGLTTKQLENTARNSSVVAGGIGGAGGYNFAAYTQAESRKRGPRTPVKKNMDMLDLGDFGTEGIAKNWEPVASSFTVEGRRKKNTERLERGAGAVSAGLAAGGISESLRSGRLRRKAVTARAAKKQVRGFDQMATGARNRSAKLAGAAVVAGGVSLAAGHHKKKEFGKSAFGVEHD